MPVNYTLLKVIARFCNWMTLGKKIQAFAMPTSYGKTRDSFIIISFCF